MIVFGAVGVALSALSAAPHVRVAKGDVVVQQRGAGLEGAVTVLVTHHLVLGVHTEIHANAKRGIVCSERG